MDAKRLLKPLLPFVIIVMAIMTSCEELMDDMSADDIRDKIEGQWKCDETSEYYKSTAVAFPVYISSHPDDSTLVYIDNIYELGFEVSAIARVSGHNLYISSQTIGDGTTNYTISGSGTIASNFNEINWNYAVDDGSGSIDHVTALFTRY